MTNNTKNQNGLQPVKFDTAKALNQRIEAINVAKKLDEGLKLITAPFLPTFGGNEIVTCLAFIQTFKGTVQKAQYETTKHFVEYVKGGNKVYTAIMDGEKQAIGRNGQPVFNLDITDGEKKYKKERYLVEPSVKGDVIHKLLIDFAASNVGSFSHTLGEGLQVAESNLFTKMQQGVKVLKNARAALTIALQVGDNVISTSFIADNSISADFLNPATYKGKDEKEQKEIWGNFCSAIYQSLKNSMNVGKEQKLNDVYKALVEIK
jgi:hypothetical protein